MSRFCRVALFAVALTASIPSVASCQAAPAPDAIHNLKWRSIGPFRAGRTKSAAGVPSQPNVFYMAPSNGGAWKTNDYGRTWRRKPAGIHCDHRFLCAVGEHVQGSGNHFLACSRFAGDQHIRIGGTNPGQQFQHWLHGWCFGDHHWTALGAQKLILCLKPSSTA